MSELDDLIENAKNYEMSPEEKKEQRISFAYGNSHIDNPDVTREMVEAADKRSYDRGGPCYFVRKLMDYFPFIKR